MGKKLGGNPEPDVSSKISMINNKNQQDKMYKVNIC